MTRDRLIELDGLRGIAALWVVLYHFTSGVTIWVGPPREVALAYTPTLVNLEGVMAVHLFFIISGFVITLTIGRCRTVMDFAAGRIARLFPAYWVAVILATAAALLVPVPSHPVTLWQALVNLTMLQEFVGVADVNPSFWSLALELGFYVVVAGLLAMGQVRRIERAGFVWVLASFAAIGLAQVGLALPWRVTAILGLPSAPLFYAGILFFQIWADRPTVLRVVGILLCLASTMPRLGGPGTTEGLIEIANFTLVAAAVFGRIGVLRHPVLQFLGAISYSLYVLHAVAGSRLQLLLHDAGASPWFNFAITTALVIALASVVTVTIERPGGRLLRTAYRRWREAPLLNPLPLAGEGRLRVGAPTPNPASCGSNHPHPTLSSPREREPKRRARQMRSPSR